VSRILTAEEILQADDLPKELVEVPEWGGEVYVRTMTGLERDSWEGSIVKMKPRRVNGRNIQEPEIIFANARAKLLAKVLCDENGKSLFSEHQVDVLGGKSAAALDKCFTVAQKLNHLTNEDVEELTKNS
jgi:hypothetical protein